MILVLSQRDIRHPQAGGAERYTHHAIRVLAKRHQVVHIGMHSCGLPRQEIIDRVHYIREGNNFLTVILAGMRFYRHHRKDIQLIIDHANTHQFFTFLWARNKRIFLVHQLTQEIWNYFYGNSFGKVLRFLEERLLSMSRGPAITVSNSTEQDLKVRGFQPIYICPEGNELKSRVLPPLEDKGDYLVYVGRLVPYKRVEDAIFLASQVKRRLYIIGGGNLRYVRRLKHFAKELGADCVFMGKTSDSVRDRMIQCAYLLVFPSIREGWGLVITESAHLGTPSLVYPVPGVVDAVRNGSTGFVADSVRPEGLVKALREITTTTYQDVREAAFAASLDMSWDETGSRFEEIVEAFLENGVPALQKGCRAQ